MEKFFFITAMMLNLDTMDTTPKYQQMLVFYDRINCEAYVQQNYTALKKTTCNNVKLVIHHYNLCRKKSTKNKYKNTCI